MYFNLTHQSINANMNVNIDVKIYVNINNIYVIYLTHLFNVLTIFPIPASIAEELLNYRNKSKK